MAPRKVTTTQSHGSTNRRGHGVEKRSFWVMLGSFWVMLGSFWVMLGSFWVTLVYNETWVLRRTRPSRRSPDALKSDTIAGRGPLFTNQDIVL